MVVYSRSHRRRDSDLSLVLHTCLCSWLGVFIVYLDDLVSVCCAVQQVRILLLQCLVQ